MKAEIKIREYEKLKNEINNGIEKHEGREYFSAVKRGKPKTIE